MYVKLEEAKKHLLLDDSFKDDDLYILGLIDVAEDAVARNLNLKLDELAVDGEFTPPAVIHAILLLIGNLYANREPVSYSSVNKVPYTFDYLISLYKNYKEVRLIIYIIETVGQHLRRLVEWMILQRMYSRPNFIFSLKIPMIMK